MRRGLIGLVSILGLPSTEIFLLMFRFLEYFWMLQFAELHPFRYCGYADRQPCKIILQMYVSQFIPG